MKITNAVILVELDGKKEYRQLFIKEGENKERLLNFIKKGYFHDDVVTISENIIDTITIEKAIK